MQRYWGLSALTGSWGYGYNYGYVNPYYTTTVVATAPAYDYSQPIVINNYIDSGDQNVSRGRTSTRPGGIVRRTSGVQLVGSRPRCV